MISGMNLACAISCDKEAFPAAANISLRPIDLPAAVSAAVILVEMFRVVADMGKPALVPARPNVIISGVLINPPDACVDVNCILSKVLVLDSKASALDLLMPEINAAALDGPVLVPETTAAPPDVLMLAITAAVPEVLLEENSAAVLEVLLEA